MNCLIKTIVVLFSFQFLETVAIFIFQPSYVCQLGYINFRDPLAGVCLPQELPKEPWSYGGLTNGPCVWGILFPNCSGDMQSPININTFAALFNRQSISLNITNYDTPVAQGLVENDGESVKIMPQDSVVRTIVVNGMIYSLQMVHFHWNEDIYRGSEHAFNGREAALEAHFVHSNAQNEIAVVAVLYNAAIFSSNEGFTPIIPLLKDITYKGQSTQLKEPLSLNKLLPRNQKSFYRYQGSLTTPPCNQGVVWSVFSDISIINRRQLANFFDLYAVEKSEADNNPACKLTRNDRPLQPLNNRNVILAES